MFLAMKLLRELFLIMILSLSAVLPGRGVNTDIIIPEDAIENINTIEVVDGLQVKLWAAEPLLQDPVSIYIDEKGRIFSAETERQTNGVEDNRGHGYWLMDDLAAQTVDDRLAMFTKWQDRFEGGLDYFRRGDEWVRLLEDTDGDGLADKSSYFARNFNDPLDGTGAGVFHWNGDVYYTNIPHLWRLRDIDNDGVAEEREAMFSGFGVRVALRGHDMHGMVMGPDGKLYWSIGDRGYHVRTREGGLLHDPGSGAVFRCNLDGSDLEVFHTSLRNPQELAFDKYGNLFTGDNNSDSGDRARIVYCVEGGESGWNMAYQYLDGDYSRGPWNNEKLWHLQHEGQAAWVLPPIDHIGNGPSGFTFYPGTGLPARYNGHFFMCDFRGGAAQSLVHSFGMENDGAGFRTTDRHDFIKRVLVTDFDFGFDGKMYLSDWVASWNHNGQGRIYSLQYKNLPENDKIQDMKQLVADGFAHRNSGELGRLLAHDDMRVRLRAQLELASRGAQSLEIFQNALQRGPQIQRIHALWGLGILARDHARNPDAYERHPLAGAVRFARHKDPEIRAQAARVLGDARFRRGTERVIDELLQDENARVRYFAALAAGKNRLTDRIDAIVSILAENRDSDVYLRHGCVMALQYMADRQTLVALGDHESAAVRRGALLALRKQKDASGISHFLSDSNEWVVTEAARAINDLNLESEFPLLAGYAVAYDDQALPQGFSKDNEALLRRIINANFRLGTTENASRILGLVRNENLSTRIRTEAIRSLGDWFEPSPLDRVLGWHRPVTRAPETDKNTSSGQTVQALFERELPSLLNELDDQLSEELGQAMARLGIVLQDDQVVATISDTSKPVSQRLAAIAALSDLDQERFENGIRLALDSGNAEISSGALKVMVDRLGADAFPRLRLLAFSEVPALRNNAMLQIGRINSQAARQFFLENVLSKLGADSVDNSIHLELIELASSAEIPGFKSALDKYYSAMDASDEMKPWMVALYGGDPARGQSLFESHPIAQCLRCHKVGDTGVGEAGPNLKGVASRLSPTELLESLIVPNAKLAEGFGPVSAMPPMGLLLSKTEIRDIMAYIKTLR